MPKNRMIYETAVYCGRLKEWRVLNLNTGTIYSMRYETEDEALASIDHGKKRVEMRVCRMILFDILNIIRNIME